MSAAWASFAVAGPQEHAPTESASCSTAVMDVLKKLGYADLVTSGTMEAAEARAWALWAQYRELLTSGIVSQALSHSVVFDLEATSAKQVFNCLDAFRSPVVSEASKEALLAHTFDWLNSFVGGTTDLTETLGTSIAARAKAFGMTRAQYDDFVHVWQSVLAKDPEGVKRAIGLALEKDPAKIITGAVEAMPRKKWRLFGRRQPLASKKRVVQDVAGQRSAVEAKAAAANKDALSLDEFLANLNSALPPDRPMFSWDAQKAAVGLIAMINRLAPDKQLNAYADLFDRIAFHTMDPSRGVTFVLSEPSLLELLKSVQNAIAEGRLSPDQIKQVTSMVGDLSRKMPGRQTHSFKSLVEDVQRKLLSLADETKVPLSVDPGSQSIGKALELMRSKALPSPERAGLYEQLLRGADDVPVESRRAAVQNILADAAASAAASENALQATDLAAVSESVRQAALRNDFTPAEIDQLRQAGAKTIENALGDRAETDAGVKSALAVFKDGTWTHEERARLRVEVHTPALDPQQQKLNELATKAAELDAAEAEADAAAGEPATHGARAHRN